MKRQDSICGNSISSQDFASRNYEEGIQDQNIQLSEICSVSIEAPISLQNTSELQRQSSPPISSISKNQSNTPVNRGENSGQSGWQHSLHTILDFLGKQITNQLPPLLISILVFVLVAMLIYQNSDGFKLKLDLEVSPISNPIEKVLEAK
jgi:hypothetical protein